MSQRSWLIAQLDAMHQSRGGDWYYRTFAPGRALAEIDGIFVINVDQAHRRLQQICLDADVLVINGVCSSDLLPVMAERRRRGRLSVFEINDDVQEMAPSNPLARFFAVPENVRLFRRLALFADAVQYSVPELDRLYGALNRRGRVFLNQMVAVPPLPDRPSGGPVTIGWGGSAGHFEDVAEVAPVLLDVLERHPQARLALMCSDRIWSLFDALADERKRRTPTGSVQDYYGFLSTLDIGIAPNRDHGFNRSRSDVKFIEYAAHGAAPVLQRSTPYLQSVVHEQNGYLFGDPGELGSLLERLLTDDSERRRLREAAHAYVRAQRMLAPHARERFDFYAELLPERPAGSRPEQSFEELAQLAGAERDGRHLMLAHTRYESLLHDGLLALQTGREVQRGAALLRQAAELEPGQASPHLYLGVLTRDRAELELATKKDPRSLQAALALGDLLFEQGERHAALQQFLAAAELAPGYEVPFGRVAGVLRQAGAHAEAAEFERIGQNMAAALSPTL